MTESGWRGVLGVGGGLYEYGDDGLPALGTRDMENDKFPGWRFTVTVDLRKKSEVIGLEITRSDPEAAHPTSLGTRFLAEVGVGLVSATRAEMRRELQVLGHIWSSPESGVQGSPALVQSLLESADSVTDAKPRPGPRGMSPLEKARFARDYVEHCAAPAPGEKKWTNAQLGEKYGFGARRAANLASELRPAYLTKDESAPSGRPHGELTPLSIRLLAGEQES